MRLFATTLTVFLLSTFKTNAEDKSHDASIESQIESQIVLLKVEKILGQFFDEPKTLAEYMEYLPDTDQYGWCCTTSPSDFPYSIKTFDFDPQIDPQAFLQFEFVMDKSYKGKVQDMKIYAARLFCTLESYGTRFYLEPNGSSHYEKQLEKKQKPN